MGNKVQMGNKEPKDLSAAEWKVMKVVWELKKGTAKDIYTLAVKEYGWAAGTVKTLIRRLVAKGYLDTTPTGNGFIYRPKRSALSSLRGAADDLLSRAAEGTVGPILVHMVRRSELRPEDAAELQSVLNEMLASSSESNEKDDDVARKEN